ncbi:hypothetical protein [Actinoplanes sichuanensis]|uniref:Uncharacterized protein n=1 Tax=Actinoplanes sichuanensis TaxID=512349 RepID=A0ABW4A7L9_9ACTN
MLDRPWVHAALAEPDPHRQIALQVEGVGEVLRRAAHLLDILRNAATDPEPGSLHVPVAARHGRDEVV